MYKDEVKVFFLCYKQIIIIKNYYKKKNIHKKERKYLLTGRTKKWQCEKKSEMMRKTSQGKKRRIENEIEHSP